MECQPASLEAGWTTYIPATATATATVSGTPPVRFGQNHTDPLGPILTPSSKAAWGTKPQSITISRIHFELPLKFSVLTRATPTVSGRELKSGLAGLGGWGDWGGGPGMENGKWSSLWPWKWLMGATYTCLSVPPDVAANKPLPVTPLFFLFFILCFFFFCFFLPYGLSLLPIHDSWFPILNSPEMHLHLHHTCHLPLATYHLLHAPKHEPLNFQTPEIIGRPSTCCYFFGFFLGWTSAAVKCLWLWEGNWNWA